MWPRASEAAIGVWLVLSPFLLGAPAVDAYLVPAAAGALVLAIDWASRRARLLHFVVVGVALVLIVWGWARFPRPGPPIAQSAILSGLTLGLLGIIPNRASDPPPGWRPHARDP